MQPYSSQARWTAWSWICRIQYRYISGINKWSENRNKNRTNQLLWPNARLTPQAQKLKLKALKVLMISSSHGSDRETANADNRKGTTVAASKPGIDTEHCMLWRIIGTRNSLVATAAGIPRSIPRNQLNARRYGLNLRQKGLKENLVLPLIILWTSSWPMGSWKCSIWGRQRKRAQ